VRDGDGQGLRPDDEEVPLGMPEVRQDPLTAAAERRVRCTMVGMTNVGQTVISGIESGSARIAVVGLGYVGLPLAVAFGRHHDTVGFDLSLQRIDALRTGVDPSGETSAEDMRSAARLRLTCCPDDLEGCDVFIVAVPTPVDRHNIPDISPLVSASMYVGRAMREGSLVVYESTVYPGCTEDDCVPVLERESGLRMNEGFLVGYSPERINPGDRKHSLENVVKIVSGSTPEALEAVGKLYGKVVRAGTHPVASIKVAEAAKVIENAQRDINIAFANELSMIFRRMGLDTHAILDAAATKWNFLDFRPGLVGGHCIGVDPYYLAHKAQEFGYHPEIILAGRRLNDGMGAHVAREVVKLMILKGHQVSGALVRVLGCTFKENCSDARNSKVFDIVRELHTFGCGVQVIDPRADAEFVHDHYGVWLREWETSIYDKGWFDRATAVVVAVAHDEFRRLDFGPSAGRDLVVYDVKGILPQGMADGRL
jgi:UDP-N-acetyl-D-galactosamine dehydrogenase